VADFDARRPMGKLGRTRMVSQCISAACVLGIVILGMLIMTQAMTQEQAMKSAGRALLFVMGAMLAVCMFKRLLISVIPWLASLKATLLRLALIVLVVIGLILVARWIVSKVQS